MRPIAIFVLALATVPALTRGVGAQAVERTDTPKRGTVRFTFDPQTTVWNDAFTPHGRRPLGWALTSDSVGAAAGPTLARIEQDVRTAGRLPGFIASLGKGPRTHRAPGAGPYGLRRRGRPRPVPARRHFGRRPGDRLDPPQAPDRPRDARRRRIHARLSAPHGRARCQRAAAPARRHGVRLW